MCYTKNPDDVIDIEWSEIYNANKRHKTVLEMQFAIEEFLFNKILNLTEAAKVKIENIYGVYGKQMRWGLY